MFLFLNSEGSCDTGKNCDLTSGTCVCIVDASTPGTAAAPNSGCTPLNPLCIVNTATNLPECVCKQDDLAKCDIAKANQCSDTIAGTCLCGTGAMCDSDSTVPVCLLDDGSTPTDDISMVPTCKVNHLSYNS